MQKINKLLFLTMLFIALIGCSTKKIDSKDITEVGTNEVQGGEIKVAYSAKPPTLDVHMTTAISSIDIMWHVFEPLLAVDSDYNIKPMLAESYEQSDDGKTITFNLRKGVYFHNGEEMLAEDVVASMNRWKKLTTNGKSQFSDATFEAIDEYTVVLSLPEPLSIALNTLAYPSSSYAGIMPKGVIESAGETGVDKLIGTGPFKFVEWKQDQHIHLAKFEDYQSRSEPASGMVGKKEALVDDLYFVFTPDSSTRLAGLQSGEFDVGHGMNYDHAELLEDDPNITNFVYPAAYLTINLNKKKGLFSDLNARQAISTALDMEEILKGAFINEKYYTLNHSNMMSHQLEQWNSNIGKEQYNQGDIEKAKQLLADAGYNGEQITLLTDREYEEHYDASIVIQEQLEKVGMNINLEVNEFSTVVDRISKEDEYDMYVMGLTPNPDPSAAVYLKKDYAGWTSSPELDKIIEEYRYKPSLEEVKTVYDDLQGWYWDYMPAVRIGDYNAVMSVSNTVEGYGEQNKQNRPMYWNVSNNK